MKRGAFIVFEGCDRCGKSTQSKKIVEYLNKKGLQTQYLTFPARDTPIGSLINSYLTKNLDVSDESIHLLFSANRWEINKKMKTLLDNGVNLIVDRYSYSGVAFTAAKGLSYEWCKAPEKGLLKPDLVLYMKIASNVLLDRGDFGRERYENKEFQDRVRVAYQKLHQDEGTNWLEVNADQSIDVIFDYLKNVISDKIQEIEEKPLKLLW